MKPLMLAADASGSTLMKIQANLFSRTTLAVACSALLVLSGCEAGNIEGEIDGGSVGVDQLTPEDGVGDAVGQDVLVDIAQDVAAPDALTDCGDGERSETEACDDGNLDSGDGCDPTCQVEPGWVCDLVNCFCDEGFFGEACLPCPDCGVHGACPGSPRTSRPSERSVKPSTSFSGGSIASTGSASR